MSEDTTQNPSTPEGAVGTQPAAEPEKAAEGAATPEGDTPATPAE